MTARTFQATNPATGQPLAPAFPVTTPQEMEALVAAARGQRGPLRPARPPNAPTS
ncbi:hypothetical protein ACFP9V_03830 [Deinococcus radiopugnans]|uniref:hypothetical protein n=1 Tax=Deinococcus radiopugnans TaxID=57497 RepID=UPI003622E722